VLDLGQSSFVLSFAGVPEDYRQTGVLLKTAKEIDRPHQAQTDEARETFWTLR
jgi:hypothetical protein